MALERAALARLGKNYLRIHNYEEALHYLGEAVMQGVTAAAEDLYQLGLHFYKKEEYKEAEEAFQILADRGHAKACLMLGDMCQYGRGRRADREAAFGYYSESYNQGLALGAYKAGLLMMPDAMASPEIRDIAASWFTEAINGGVTAAYAAMGHLYSENTGFLFHDILQKDNRVSLSWYLRGAMQGDPSCMEEAALCFLDGTGAKKDVKRGLELLVQAAEAGRPSASMHLGQMYEMGLDVYKNYPAAISWYLKAEEQGDLRGRYQAGRAACGAGDQMVLFARNEEEKDRASRYFDQAIEYNYAPACFSKAHLEKERGHMEGYVAALTEGSKRHNDDCRMELVYYYTTKALPLIEKLPRLSAAAEQAGKGTAAWETYAGVLREALNLYKKAAAARDPDAWAMLAKLYLYRGADAGITEKQFLFAAKRGRRATTLDTDELLWLYYGPEKPASPGALHREDAKEAFTCARKLAEKGKKKYFPILADYYRKGYGVRKNMTTASHWENKK